MPHIIEQHLGFLQGKATTIFCGYANCDSQRSRQELFLLCARLVRPHLAYRLKFWSLQRKWQAGVEGRPVRLESFAWEERQCHWLWFSWEQGWLRGIQQHPQHHWQDEGGTPVLFTAVCHGGLRDSNTKWNTRGSGWR